MGSGCEQDCSICCCGTLNEKKFQRNIRSLAEKPKSIPQRPKNGNRDVLKLPLPLEGGHVDSRNYIPRDVTATVRSQVELAVFGRSGSENITQFDRFEYPGITKLKRATFTVLLGKTALQPEHQKSTFRVIEELSSE